MCLLDSLGLGPPVVSEPCEPDDPCDGQCRVRPRSAPRLGSQPERNAQSLVTWDYTWSPMGTTPDESQGTGNDGAGQGPPEGRWGWIYAAVLAHLGLWITLLWILTHWLGDPV